MRAHFLSILLASILLTACDSYIDTQRVEIQSSDTEHKLTTAIPTALRNIPVTALSVSVKVNENESRHQGTDSSDGQWLIEVELVPNQEYELVVKWFSSEFLLLEEFGRFTTPATGSTITPELDYRSAGLPEFDADCDGYSNLEEIKNGTSLTIAENSTTSACSENGMSVELSDAERAFIFRLHDSVEANETLPRLTSFAQSIQINAVSPSANIAFIANLRSSLYESATGESLVNAGWLSFRQQPDAPRFLEFAIYPATGYVESDIDGQFCKSLMSEPAGLMCTVPYGWQEDRWYTISIEETSPTSWRAQVRDQETQITQQIATFNTPEGLIWAELSTGMIDYIDYTQMECMSGLPASRMTYKSAVVNNAPVGTTRLQPSDCVIGGAGWSEGFRSVQDSLEYKLTMGRTP